MRKSAHPRFADPARSTCGSQVVSVIVSTVVIKEVVLTSVSLRHLPSLAPSTRTLARIRVLGDRDLLERFKVIGCSGGLKVTDPGLRRAESRLN